MRGVGENHGDADPAFATNTGWGEHDSHLAYIEDMHLDIKFKDGRRATVLRELMIKSKLFLSDTQAAAVEFSINFILDDGKLAASTWFVYGFRLKESDCAVHRKLG